MALITLTSPKYFLGTYIPNTKVLSAKIDELINALNNFVNGDNMSVPGTFTAETTSTFTGIATFTAAPVLKNTIAAVTADGAITIPSGNKTFAITKAGVAAMTLANPTATTHDGLRLTFISTTAQAHTLDNSAGAGFNDGGAASDIGTFGGAKGDNIVIEAYQGKWYVVSKVNVTLA